MSDRAAASVLLTHAIGLHARPSVKLTKLAKQFKADVNLASAEDGPWLNAKSIAKVMGAKIPVNSTLYFEADGEDASAAVHALVALVEQDFELA